MNQRADAQDGNGSPRPESLHRSRPSNIKYYLAVLQRVLYSKHPGPAPMRPPASLGLAPSEHYRRSMPPTPPPSPVNTIFHLQHQAPLSCPADRIVPSFIRPWNGFEISQQARLESCHAYLPDSAAVLPSLDHLANLESSMLSESQNADVGSKLVQIFFHYAVEVPVAQIIGVLNGLPAWRPLDLMGNVFFPSHLDTPSTSMAPPGRNVEEREQRIHWLIPSQSYVYRREGNGPRTNVPICVNQYHSPDDLNFFHLQAGLESLSRLSEPLTNAHFGRFREVGGSPNWSFEERKTLLALTNAYTVMVKSNLTFGLVATGDAILFLTLDSGHPGTLFFKLMNPTVDDIKMEGGRISSNSAAAAQCLSFYLLVLLEAFQRERYPRAANTRGCYCNHPVERVCPSVLRRGPGHPPEVIPSPPRLTANWPPHLWPPEPPPVPVYTQSLQVPLTLGSSPNPHTGVVASVKSQHMSPSTVVWTRSSPVFGQNTPCLPVANRNATTVQGVEASRAWPVTPFASHQPAVPPIALRSAGVEAHNLVKLPPIASILMGIPAPKLPVALGAVQAGSPGSDLPTLLPRPSARSQPQAYRNVHIVSPDAEMTRRLAVNIRHRQVASNGPSQTRGLQPPQTPQTRGLQSPQTPQTRGLQSPQTPQDDQQRREDALHGGRNGYIKSNSDEAVVKFDEVAVKFDEVAVKFDEAAVKYDEVALKFHEAAVKLDEAAMKIDEAVVKFDEVAVKLERGDDGEEKKYSSAEYQRREAVLAHALRQSTAAASATSSPGASSNPYCTHLCLLGLLAGQFTDLDCPNVDSHGRADETSDHKKRRHKISYAKFLDLVTNSFLQANGNSHKLICGDVSKVTLSEYKYTFLCKRFKHKPEMDYEVAIFNRLATLQGKHVPILLGHLSLRQRVGEPSETGLVHYTLMSSAGVPLLGSPELVDMNREVLARKAGDIVRAFHAHGVSFRATLRNTFFDHFQETVAVAGLGSARILEAPQPPCETAGVAGTKHARDEAATTRRGTPRKRQRTETGSSVVDAEPMSLRRLATLWSEDPARADVLLRRS
ncbi:unnamed protein product [Clonostachys rhizophaga]|uniref:Uncharacterized protein n=1 Tax=Clonostachys rhizophaga TaxID=160324 RepID=A0A9N9VHU8_9HYPO|nr:unnamed protein product [Clonostachys rhizophaga]